MSTEKKKIKKLMKSVAFKTLAFQVIINELYELKDERLSTIKDLNFNPEDPILKATIEDIEDLFVKVYYIIEKHKRFD